MFRPISDIGFLNRWLPITKNLCLPGGLLAPAVSVSSGLRKKVPDRSLTVAAPYSVRRFASSYGAARVSKRCSKCLFPQPAKANRGKMRGFKASVSRLSGLAPEAMSNNLCYNLAQ